ncbi:MAG: type II secretion system protein GspN [Desulfobacteraceae bacterium]|jgi:type II secretion system protein N
MKKHRKWLGYVLYGLLLSAALLYYLFPSDALRDYLQASVEGVDPRLSLSIEKLSPSFNAGVKLLKAELSHRELPGGVLFRAERLLIRPKIWSLLRGKRTFLFRAFAHKGELKGYAEFAENSLAGPFTLSLQLRDIQIEELEDLRDLLGRRVQGGLSGTVSLSGKYDALIDGHGEADLRLAKGSVELLEPILGLQSVEFEDLWVKVLLKNRKMELAQAALRGPNMTGRLTGTVVLREEFSKSRLDLKGTIEPLGDLYRTLAGRSSGMKFLTQRLKGGKLSFVIQGAIERPRIRFI